MDKIPITRLGYERLYWQLQYLCRVVRREVASDLASARGHGIKPRNLEWRTAREKQHLVENRIQILREQLASCEIRLSPPLADGRVDFGLWVRVVNHGTGEVSAFQMVGPFESDVAAGRLSVLSPVGRVLMGRRVGEMVTADCPGGVRLYRVVEVIIPDQLENETPLSEAAGR